MPAPVKDSETAAWGLSGLLLQVSPGWERWVADRYMGLEGSLPRCHAYYALGASDLCILSFGRDLAIDFSRLSLLAHVRNVNHFMAFGWEQYSAPESALDWSAPLAMVGFLKVSPELILAHGVAAEWAMMEAVIGHASAYGLDSKRQFSVMGGLGWSRLVYVALGDNLGQLHAFSESVLADIRDRTGRPAFCRGQSTAGVALEVMDALRTEAFAEYRDKRGSWHLFDDSPADVELPPLAGEARPRASGHEYLPIRGTVVPVITLTCESGHEQQVAEHLHRTLDLVGLRAEIVSLNEEHRLTAALRTPGTRAEETSTRLAMKALAVLAAPYQEKVGLLSTATRFHFPISRTARRSKTIPLEPLPDVPDWSTRFDVTRLSALLAQHGLPAQLGRWLSEMCFAYNAVIRRRELFTAFADMRDFVRSQLETAANQEWLDDPGQYIELFENLSQIFGTGFPQRAKGIYFSNEVEPVPLVSGSAERIIHACDFLCRDVLRAAGKKPWTGFAFFGNTINWQRGYAGTMNLPVQHLLLPERWHGILHEIGHEYTSFYDQLEEAHSQELQALDSYLSDLGVVDEKIEAVRTKILWEIVADIFDYRCGFGEDWELLGKTVWHFLATFPRTKDELEAYVVRHFFVYMYAFGEDPLLGDDPITAFAAYREQIACWVDEVDPAIRHRLDWEARLSNPELPGYYPRLKDWLRRIRPALDALPGRESVRDHWEALSQGKVLRDGFRSQDVVLSLWRRRDQIESSAETAFRARMAAIVSLWDSEMRKGLLKNGEPPDQRR